MTTHSSAEHPLAVVRSRPADRMRGRRKMLRGMSTISAKIRDQKKLCLIRLSCTALQARQELRRPLSCRRTLRHHFQLMHHQPSITFRLQHDTAAARCIRRKRAAMRVFPMTPHPAGNLRISVMLWLSAGPAYHSRSFGIKQWSSWLCVLSPIATRIYSRPTTSAILQSHIGVSNRVVKSLSFLLLRTVRVSLFCYQG